MRRFGRGATLLEALIVMAIFAALLFFIVRACNSGGAVSAAKGSAIVSAAMETVKIAAKNFAIAMSPISDCNREAALTADVAEAQTKIDDAARNYPQEYAANKAAIARDIATLNQSIRGYNHDCNASIPDIIPP